MPIHDWTRVDAGIWHDFHLTWIGALKIALNEGLLPPDYYALAEPIAGGFEPDVLTLHAPESDSSPSEQPGVLALADAPPKARMMLPPEQERYTRKRRTLVIRHVSGDRIIALIEMLSPGNKSSRSAIRAFLHKATSALNQGIHLLLIDLFPPTSRDPEGIHGALWEELYDAPYEQPDDRGLTLASYTGGPAPVAYLEPVAVGVSLPDMPLFLHPEKYVNVPLEKTYASVYKGVPAKYRKILEGKNVP